MTAAGHLLASIDGISDWTSSVMETRCFVARPSSIHRVGWSFGRAAGCSSVFMTGIRGATPPPAG